MIVHIFTAERYHLVPNIAKTFVTTLGQNRPIIILFGDKRLNRQTYIDIFAAVNFSDYYFCTTIKEYIRLIEQFRNNDIIFHAGKYLWFFLAFALGCKKVSWVCWGAGASIGKSLKSRCFTPIKKCIYRSFKTIVVLLEADKESLIHDFNVEGNRVQVIPYPSSTRDKHKELYLFLMEKQTDNRKPLVLLGNNPDNIDNYIELLNKLSIYSGKILIQCMLHYSLVKNEKYYKLISTGQSIYGEDFRSNEEFYKFEDYIQYMSKSDVYICGAEKQSGLGAIYTSLSLGKKIYISGKNYEWIKSMGGRIYNINEINNTLPLEEFVSDISHKDKILNHNIIDNIYAQTPAKWNQYLCLLCADKS